MAELRLKRTILLDNGEVIPTGAALLNLGDFTPLSIAPSTIAEMGIRTNRRLKRKELSLIDEKKKIYFFRIPRRCIEASSLTGQLKKVFEKGSEDVSPFFCSVRAGWGVRQIEENNIEYHVSYFDSKMNPIRMILISSLSELNIGAHGTFSDLKPVLELQNESYLTTVATYYYPKSSNIHVDSLSRKKFYATLPSYKTEIHFDELTSGMYVGVHEVLNS